MSQDFRLSIGLYHHYNDEISGNFHLLGRQREEKENKTQKEGSQLLVLSRDWKLGTRNSVQVSLLGVAWPQLLQPPLPPSRSWKQESESRIEPRYSCVRRRHLSHGQATCPLWRSVLNSYSNCITETIISGSEGTVQYASLLPS